MSVKMNKQSEVRTTAKLPWLQSSSESDPTMNDAAKIINELRRTPKKFFDERVTRAARQLCQLSDQKHTGNRVPLLHKFNALDAITERLQTISPGDTFLKRYLLIALNNMAIPYDNKLLISSRTDLMSAVCGILIKTNFREGFLASIIFSNVLVTKASDAPDIFSEIVDCVLYISTNGKVSNPLNCHNSLLRIVERNILKDSETMKNPLSCWQKLCLGTNSGSKQKFAIRDLQWNCSLIKNLVLSQEGAQLVAQTEIPKWMVEYLRDTDKSPNCWEKFSTEEFCLMSIINMSHYAPARAALIQLGCISVINDVRTYETRYTEQLPIFHQKRECSNWHDYIESNLF